MILNGEEPTEDVYDDVTHAAVHRKAPDGQSAFLANMFKEPQVNAERPTSGKHFAREHAHAKRKGELEPPNHDPLTSNVAKNYETSKKVETLLNKLAGYMAGEIPDNGDLDELFQPDPEKKDGIPDQDTVDDATTAYTGYHTVQPTNRDPVIPKIIVADENEVEIEETEEEQIPDDLEDTEMETNIEDDPSINVTLPEIYQSIKGRNRQKTIVSSPQRKRVNEENLFIYKDFDTSLTAVKGPVKQLALLDQTTSKRGEDLIRDRLLSFNLRSGNLNTLDRGDRKEETMIERSAALK